MIESERLELRRYEAADAVNILDLVGKNREMLIRNFSQLAKGITDEGRARLFVQEKMEQWNSGKGFCYGIWRKESKDLIGQLLVKNIVWDVPVAELSYFISNAFQRRGFAAEAIGAMLKTIFEELGFQRTFLRIIPSNKESILLAKKLRFRQEGLHRNDFRCGHGELHDVHYFALTVEDYRQDKAALLSGDL
jgi:RimJ/RimL family protein N-acetyltransferase